MEETVNIQQIVQTLKKRIVFILTTTLLFLILGAIVTFFIMIPRYEASTQILVNQSQEENQEAPTTDIESSRELISTYNVIMTSPAILEPVIENANFDGSVGELRSKINVSAEEESQVASVTVSDSDPEKAVILANTLGRTFEERIPNIMNIDNVSILSEAQLEESNNPVSPNPSLNLIASLMIGLLVGIGFAFVSEFLDRSIKNEEDVEKELALPLLGTVPMMSTQEFNYTPKDNLSKNNFRANKRDKQRTGF